jgi:CRP/FNR family transcriptional regulator
VLNDFPLQRLAEFGTPTTDELADLAAISGQPVSFGRQAVIRHQGETPDHVYLLIEGWVSSAVTLPSGERQIMNIHLPGDMMGMPSICLIEAADSLHALTPVVVRKVPVARLAQLFARSPTAAARLFLGSQRERVALMDRLVALGARPATGRVAALLVDLRDRLGQIGQVRDDEFVLRMTQDEIGDYLGLTAVHVNRTFRQLVERGLMTRRLQRFRLLDVAALKEMAGYIPREVNAGCSAAFEGGERA